MAARLYPFDKRLYRRAAEGTAGLPPTQPEMRGVGLLAAQDEAADRELRVARDQPVGEGLGVGGVDVLVLGRVHERDREALLQARIVGDHDDELAALGELQP